MAEDFKNRNRFVDPSQRLSDEECKKRALKIINKYFNDYNISNEKK